MSRTFPVITKLMISFDLWRLREGLWFNCFKRCYISSGNAATLFEAPCKHYEESHLRITIFRFKTPEVIGQ